MFSFISYCSEIKIILSCRVGLCDPPTQWKVVSLKLRARFQLKVEKERSSKNKLWEYKEETKQFQCS